MRVSSKAMAIIVLAMMFGGVALASSLGMWQNGSFTRGGGQNRTYADPEDLRGSTSLGETSRAFGIPLADLVKAFGMESHPNPQAIRHKDIKEKYEPVLEKGVEIGNGSVKLFVALYAGIPYKLTEETYLPKEAVLILKQRGNLTPEQLRYIESHSVDISRVK